MKTDSCNPHLAERNAMRLKICADIDISHKMSRGKVKKMPRQNSKDDALKSKYKNNFSNAELEVLLQELMLKLADNI